MSMETLRAIVAEANPAHIPSEFIISAVVYDGDEPKVMSGDEMKELLKKAKGPVRVGLATDIRAMNNYIKVIVDDVISSLSS